MSVLVVGGSGMLSEFCRAISTNTAVTVICRSEAKFSQNVASSNDSSIQGMFVDYRNTEKLMSLLVKQTDKHGKFHTVVSWLHTDVSDGVQSLISKFVNTRYYNIFGSAAASPDNSETLKAFWGSVEDVNPALHSHSIILGSIKCDESGESRWLTHREISRGVLQAYRKAESRFIVGDI